MTRTHRFFAYTVQQNDTMGVITPHLLTVCLSLEAVCAHLKRWSLKPHQVHVCGWDSTADSGSFPGTRANGIEQRKG